MGLTEILAGKKLPLLFSWNVSPQSLRELFPHGKLYGVLDPGDMWIAVGKSGKSTYEKLAEKVKLSKLTLLYKEDIDGFRVEFFQSKQTD